MVRFLERGWRDALGVLASAASRSVLIAAPFIKDGEAAWFCDRLRPDVDVLTLANIDAGAVSAAALDLAALRRLAAATRSSRVIALPNLHAKVFVADEAAAIVTSANLTRSGLERNLEYGALFEDPAHVRAVRRDMLAFARLGSEVDAETIAALAPLEAELRETRADLEAHASPDAQRRFAEALRQARQPLASAQVGRRSANAVFGEAIRVALARGPLATPDIHAHVRDLLPALCDDSETLVINGERFGKAWKHRIRNAQQQLRRRGAIALDRATGTWGLVRA